MNARLALVVALAVAAGFPPRAAHAGDDGAKSAAPTPGKKKTVKGAGEKTKSAAPAKSALPPPFFQLPEQKAARGEIEQSNLSAVVKEKMVEGLPLKLEEVGELGESGLSQEIILKALRSAGGSYQLLTRDIDRLRAAGLADEVLDYLLSTPARRPLYYPYLYSYPSFYHRDYYYDSHHYGSGYHYDSGYHSGSGHHY